MWNELFKHLYSLQKQESEERIQVKLYSESSRVAQVSSKDVNELTNRYQEESAMAVAACN